MNIDYPDSDIQNEQLNFEQFYDNKYNNVESKIENIVQRESNGETLSALVKNIKIEKQIAGRNKKRKKVQWNEKNTKLFQQLFQFYSGNLDQILLYFQQNNELKTQIDIKQIRNKYKIEKKKNTLSLAKQSQKISKNQQFQLKLDQSPNQF